MPYLYSKEDALVPRVTQVASAPECEMTAYLNPIHKKERGEWHKLHPSPMIRYNLAAVAGTLGHNRLENNLRQQIGLPIEPAILNKADQAQIGSLMKNRQRYNIFLDKIENAYTNFLHFWDEYKDDIKIVAIEKKIRNIKRLPNGKVDPFNSLAGTIDLLALWKSDNGWRLLIIDWKTGTTALPSHYLQLCGYYNPLLTESEYYADLAKRGFLKKYPYYVENGKPQVLCVLLGANKYRTKWYEVNVNDFRKAQKKFRNPRPLPINSKTNHVGLRAGLCVVCSYEMECGEYMMHDLEIPMMKDSDYKITDLKELSLLQSYIDN